MTEAEKNLIDSGRCELFEEIASKVWKRITDAHDVNVNLREEGITYDILVDILRFSKYRNGNFDVSAKPGYDENKYGSDIDVFVETTKNQYRWFALQAKILKANNRYNTLRDGYSQTNPTYQWDKLKLLEAASGCTAFYLLYNGKYRSEDYNFKKNDSCNRPYTEDQLGCSLVSVPIIEKLGLTRNARGTRFVNPTYEDIHPHNSEPWRTLVCCMLDKADGTLYAKAEIDNYNSKFLPISEVSLEDDSLDIEKDKDSNKDIEINNDNKIALASQKAGWNPTFKIIINRSDNID
ncbi:hypothetical protein H9I45_00825 [Polaribacter haliotis]|uniref:Uncharacterized protein n=2 Tax=Polaribacter TaxID=52959 RepID=A0A7L8AG73_9FLAO|nr:MULTISPECIES: hypothetical protein [Polaribacter]MDD7914109.1 hypothetical protein [Polaribacter sp. MSW5]QOD61013.1 hypothetical protein H9I45_00825 [Polaribacter haliotis]